VQRLALLASNKQERAANDYRPTPAHTGTLTVSLDAAGGVCSRPTTFEGLAAQRTSPMAADAERATIVCERLSANWSWLNV
jgi:hypothetical protein